MHETMLSGLRNARNTKKVKKFNHETIVLINVALFICSCVTNVTRGNTSDIKQTTT